MIIWPTQVLESWWCEWPGWTNCPQNDMPTVAAATALTARLLALPPDSGLITPAQRAAYEALAAILPQRQDSRKRTRHPPLQLTKRRHLFCMMIHEMRSYICGRGKVSTNPALHTLQLVTTRRLCNNTGNSICSVLRTRSFIQRRGQ